MSRYIFSLLLLLLALPLQAAQALLVGISDYPRPITPLEGPVNDVHAVADALTRHWGVPPGNIRTLVNSQATKGRILEEIARLEQRSQTGEEVFIYLSGHGTSALDRAQNLPLPTTSGAYIPYDIGRPSNPEELVSALVVGRTDLNPLLRRLDAGGRQVFVVIDACYSGNTVRSAYGPVSLVNRYVDVSQLLPDRSFGDDFGGDVGGGFGSNTVQQEDYPYRNVFYLGASGEHEVAQDIPSNMIARMPTVDGKAHGAFTDAFLRVMTGREPADEDGDGYLSYGEIYQGLRQFMGQRPYTHTPARLPSLADDEASIATRSLFGRRAPTPHPPVRGEFTVKVEGFEGLAGKLRGEDVAITDRDAALTVRRAGGSTLLIGPGGDLVATLDTSDQDEVMEAVFTQRKVHQWVNEPFKSGFSLFSDLQGTATGSTRAAGDILGFSARAGQASYLVVVNIGPTGNVTMLYPYSESEKSVIPASQLMALHNLAEVNAPFGREIVDIYAFKEWPRELQKHMGKSYPIDSRPARLLQEALLHSMQGRGARSTLAIYTTPGN